MHQIDNRKEKKPFSVPSSPDKLICYFRSKLIGKLLLDAIAWRLLSSP